MYGTERDSYGVSEPIDRPEINSVRPKRKIIPRHRQLKSPWSRGDFPDALWNFAITAIARVTSLRYNAAAPRKKKVFQMIDFHHRGNKFLNYHRDSPGDGVSLERDREVSLSFRAVARKFARPTSWERERTGYLHIRKFARSIFRARCSFGVHLPSPPSLSSTLRLPRAFDLRESSARCTDTRCVCARERTRVCICEQEREVVLTYTRTTKPMRYNI